MHLAIDATMLSTGGGPVGLAGYLTAWRDLDIPLRITLFSSKRSVLDLAASIDSRIDLRPFSLGEKSAKTFLRRQFTLGPAIEKENADVLLTTNTLVGRCAIPQIVHHRNLLHFMADTQAFRAQGSPVRAFLRNLAARSAVRKSATNVFVSDYLRLQAEKYAPETGYKNFVIPNGIDDELLAQLRANHEIPIKEYPEVAAITSDELHKDNPELIKVFAELIRRKPEIPWRLIVAGGGHYQEEKNLATQLGIAKRIEWRGHLEREGIDSLLRKSLCLLFPSRIESFGNPPLEAMARGCPVVASNCTAIPEVVGNAGMLIPAGDTAAFADAILSLHDNHQLRQDLVELGKDRVQEFSWKRSAAEMYQLLQQAANSVHN